MMNKLKRLFFLGMALLLTAAMLPGCAAVPESPSASAAESAETASPSGGVSAEELASELISKYESNQNVTYTQGRYGVSRNETFLIELEFDPAALGLNSYPQIAALYADAELTEQIPATYSWADEEKRSFTIAPYKYPGTSIFQNGIDETTPGYSPDARFLFDLGEGQDWGNLGMMYLVRHVDLQTGEALEKPIVSVVTVKGELDTPDVRFTAAKDGTGMFSWQAVPGAEKYLILQLSDPYGMDGASVVAQTTDTYWSDEEQKDTIVDATWQANNRFANYSISEDDWLSQEFIDYYESEYDPADGPVRQLSSEYYTVVAVCEDGCSMFADIYSGDEIASQLPHTTAIEMEKQSEQGFQYYVNGVNMMPSFRWIVMCDGRLAQRLVNYDYENVTHETKTYYYYEEEDMSDMRAEQVAVLNVPYTVEGTPFDGVLVVENYDEENWQSQMEEIKARQEALRSKTGFVERELVIKGREAGSPQSNTEQTISVSEPITASCALSEYIAANMLSSVEQIDLSAFPEAGDEGYLADAWMEAVYQNPLVLGVANAYLSYDCETLMIVYEEDAETRSRQQLEIKDAVSEIVETIITDDMTSMEKEYAINQYLCDSAQYDMAALENAEKYDFAKVDARFNDSFTAYGILVKKVGVCASYAAAFKLLADAAGLESVVVTGYLEGTTPHAWNRVNLDGNWETVDVTNNDIDYIPNAILNVPDSALTVTLIEDAGYAMDNTTGEYVSENTDAEYYRVNGRYYTIDDIARHFAEQLQSSPTVVLRTDYSLTDAEYYEIGTKVMELTGNPNIGGFYWMGVIILTTDI